MVSILVWWFWKLDTYHWRRLIDESRLWTVNVTGHAHAVLFRRWSSCVLPKTHFRKFLHSHKVNRQHSMEHTSSICYNAFRCWTFLLVYHYLLVERFFAEIFPILAVDWGRGWPRGYNVRFIHRMACVLPSVGSTFFLSEVKRYARVLLWESGLYPPGYNFWRTNHSATTPSRPR